MPSTANVLPFRARPTRSTVSMVDARIAAEAYLGTPTALRSEAIVADALAQSDTLLSICLLLKSRMASAPASVYAEGSMAYGWVVAQANQVGLFDERDFFLGELAFLTSGAARYLGRFQDCERWLDRAEAAFRHTVNPTPLLANTAYARLALKHHQGHHEDVLELLPWLETSFIRLEMSQELAKARFLKSMSLKALGRFAEALEIVAALCEEPSVGRETGLHAQVFIALGELSVASGDHAAAIQAYEKAIPLVSGSGRSFVTAELKWAIGDAYRGSKKALLALEAYQAALDEYRALEMQGKESILRLVVAEVLLEAGRVREAEWQVLAALPTIDQEKMLPEGYAAIALLQESVRRRKTDPKALSEVRQYLLAKN